MSIIKGSLPRVLGIVPLGEDVANYLPAGKSWYNPKTNQYGDFLECTHQNQAWVWEDKPSLIDPEKTVRVWADATVCTACGATGTKTHLLGELGQRSENVN